MHCLCVVFGLRVFFMFLLIIFVYIFLINFILLLIISPFHERVFNFLPISRITATQQSMNIRDEGGVNGVN